MEGKGHSCIFISDSIIIIGGRKNATIIFKGNVSKNMSCSELHLMYTCEDKFRLKIIMVLEKLTKTLCS